MHKSNNKAMDSESKEVKTKQHEEFFPAQNGVPAETIKAESASEARRIYAQKHKKKDKKK